jgi:drug/metabolite transporter (DMT)-like permease
MNAVGMTVGAVLLLTVSALHGDTWTLPRHTDTRIALAYTVLGGSVAAFLLYVLALRYWPASRTSYQAVLLPFNTVALSTWLDDEPIGFGLLIGGPLILFGVYLGAIRPGRVAREAPRAAPPETEALASGEPAV